MNITCKLGFHQWNGCKCLKCEKTRDESHDWSKDCEKCAQCDKVRQNAHSWIGCECSKCGKQRHEWAGGVCKICGRRRPASVLFNAMHLAKAGRGLVVEVAGTSHYYNAKEAIRMWQSLLKQVGERGKTQSACIQLLTTEGHVEIVDDDVRQIIVVLGALINNSMLLEMMAG